MKLKKIIIAFISLLFVVIFCIWLIFNTTFGKSLIKLYFQHRINYYFPDIKIEKLIIDYNTFSMFLKQGKNFYKLYGQIYPFEALLEGQIKEIHIDGKTFKSNIILSGNAIKKNGFYLIHSNVYFDNNVGFLNIKLNKNKIINFYTKNVDVNYFFKKLNISKIKYLKAKVNLNLSKNNNYIVKISIKGLYKNIPFYSKINSFFYKLSNINFNGFIKSKILNGEFKANFNNNHLVYNGNFSNFDLSILNLMYPFKGIVSLDINKDKIGIIKFKSTNFNGFKDTKNFNIVFSMNVNKFFKFLNLKNLFNEGIVAGRIIISKNGEFNFIIKNAKLKKEVVKKLNLKTNFFEKIFVKGFFNRKRVVFDLLADNNNLTVNIKKGLILIEKNNLVPMFLIIINNMKNEFFYKLVNKNLFIVKKKKLGNTNNQILVF